MTQCTIERTASRNVTMPNGWTMFYDARNDIDTQAEREGLAMKRHAKLTRKHRRIVYRHAGIADPRP